MSVLIGKHIYRKLSDSEALKQIVEDRIFAISTLQSTKFPFVIYKRNSLVPESTKDRYNTGDAVEVEIVVADNNYSRSAEIANIIRKIIDKKIGEYDGFSVINAKLLSADEDFVEDTFLQRLVFSFETEPNILK